jgi:DNA topoisomerase-3
VGKQLIITEKPSVARDICAVLGGFTDEGEYFENDDYVVTFALGHLVELAEPEDYDQALRAWTVTTLPIIPDTFRVKAKTGQKKRLDLIKKLGSRADVDGLINACDAGREGEIIFRRIIEFTGLDNRPHRRLWLQSMTPQAIRQAFTELRDGAELDHLGDAAWLRGVGDWLVGMNTTRALTKRLKGRKERGAWSAGRVQTPTLGLMVTREREILAHRPRVYWEIAATFTHGEQTWEGHYHDPESVGHPDRDVRPRRMFDEARVEQVMAAVAAVQLAPAEEKRKQSIQRPPLLFDLTSLQREANRRFSMSAKRTLNAAQRLYEGHKLLTYPRTDSRYLPADYGETVATVIDALGADVAYKELSATIVREGPQNLDRLLDGSKVSDHFAIVPTGAEPPDNLGADDARIYDLVVRQFLAALMGPATWATVERSVTIPVQGGAEASFKTSARALEIPGFLAALGQEAGVGRQLPPLVPGSDEAAGVPVAVIGAEREEKLTNPPSRYSEAALLRLMETAGEQIDDEELAEAMKGRGLGTPATRADIIERLVKTGYTRRIDGKMGPTPKGMRLMDILERLHVPVLAQPRLTGEWEHALQQVQDGVRSKQAVLDDLISFTREVTDALTRFDHDVLFASEPPLGPCPSCKIGQVVETAWGYRCSRNTQNDPQCKLIIWKDRGGRYIDRALAERLVKEHNSGRIDGFVDRIGRTTEGVLHLEPESDEPGAQWQMRVEYGEASGAETEPEVVAGVVMDCPCGREGCRGVVETTHRFVCSLVLDGVERSGPMLPRQVCQRQMDLEEVAAYFEPEGRTDFIEGFISRRGRPFTGLLFRKPTGKHGFEFPPRGGGEGAGAEEGGEEGAGGKPKGKGGPKAKGKKPAAKAKAVADDAPAPKKAKSKPKAKKAAADEPTEVKAKAKARPSAKKPASGEPTAIKPKAKAKAGAKTKPKPKPKPKGAAEGAAEA